MAALRYGFNLLVFSENVCLVPRPQYFAAVNLFGSHGPGRSSGIRHRKIERNGLGKSRTGTKQ